MVYTQLAHPLVNMPELGDNKNGLIPEVLQVK